MSTPRGIRNHNPGNIERGAPWQGLAQDQSGDDRFAVFTSPEWGIRAIARVLVTYQDKRRAQDGSKIDTVREILDRWAPANENDTSAYAAHLRSILGVRRGETIDVYDYATMRGLVEGIIRHENGVQPYSDVTIRKGLVLAGIEPPVKPLAQSSTIRGGKVAVVGTGATMALEGLKQFEVALPFVETVGRYAPWAVGLLVLAAVGYMVWRRVEDHKLRVA